MHYSTIFTSFLAASVVVASPIAHSAPVLEARDIVLCDEGVPCWMQKAINDTLSYLNVITADFSVPITDISVGISSASTTMAGAAAYVQTALSGLGGEQAAELKADVVAAITAGMSQAVLSLNQINTTVVDTTGVVYAAIQTCVSDMLTVEAQVGPCTIPSVPIQVPLSVSSK